MHQQKFDQIYRGLTEQSKKVFDCIPISESWTPAQIMSELHRRSISLGDFRVVMGCVNIMLDSGIVLEVSRGQFRREIIKQKCEKKEQLTKLPKEPEMNHAQKPSKDQNNPLDLLGDFAKRLRTLADDAERIAMEIAGQTEKNEADTAKMRQLQAILKSLG
jgi:hypothetical protein